MLSIADLGWGSVMGNTLDNGVTYLPYGMDMGMQCGMEVVLADGEVMRTGMGAMPYPEVYMPLWLKVWRDDDLGPLMDASEKIQGAEVTGTKHAPEDTPNLEHPAERIQGGVPSLDWNNMTGWYGGEHGGHIGFSPIAPSTGADAMALRDLLRGYIEAAKLGYGEYRAHLDFMDLASEQYSFNHHAYRRFCETIKDAVDPQGILSPGKQGIWPAAMRPGRSSEA
jgi:hypothetical protein